MRIVTSIPRMYADERGLKHAELTEKLIGIFFNIHNELGHAFLESICFNFGPNAQFKRYAFENARKNPRNPRESAEKKFPGEL
ncbi:MAG: hypothetical protein WBX38_22585 [Candidatus Sulfotelmatobacter sp.]